MDQRDIVKIIELLQEINSHLEVIERSTSENYTFSRDQYFQSPQEDKQ